MEKARLNFIQAELNATEDARRSYEWAARQLNEEDTDIRELYHELIAETVEYNALLRQSMNEIRRTAKSEDSRPRTRQPFVWKLPLSWLPYADKVLSFQ